jgi:hypothetical protein
MRPGTPPAVPHDAIDALDSDLESQIGRIS